MDDKPPIMRATQEWPESLPEPLALFLAYWRQHCGPDGRPPLRRDIDPLDMPARILPGLGLIEALAQPDGRVRYRYRLLGTDHLVANGREHTGLYFDDLHPAAEMAVVEPLYARLLAGRQPHYWRRPSTDPSRRHMGYSRILAPLLNDAGEGAFLLGYWLWEHLRYGPD